MFTPTSVNRLQHLIVAAVFLYVALLQGNDPDPAYWVLVYGGTAVIALAAALDRLTLAWVYVCLGAAGAGLILAMPDAVPYFFARDWASFLEPMQAAKPWIEPAREFFGLAMVIAVLFCYLKRDQKR